MAFLSIGSLLPTICVEVDATTNPTTGTRTWTDITPLVRQLSFTRSGRNQEINRSTAGSLTAVCGDAGGAITGLGLRKRQWIRVRAQWAGVTYARWQGILENLPRKWPGEGADQLVELHAADVFKVLGFTDLVGISFPQQRNDQRVAQILPLALGSFSLDPSSSTDTDTADAVGPLADQTYALDYLLQIEASEDGLLVANPDATVVFQGRSWRFFNAATPVATFGENAAASEIPYRDDVEYVDDDSLLANVFGVTPFGASSAIVATNTASTAKYWPTRRDLQLLSSDPNLAFDAANWNAYRYGDPSPRLPAVNVELGAVARISSAKVATLLAAGNSTRFSWKRNASAAISEAVFVEQVAETVDVAGGSWQWTAQLSPADDRAAWIAEDATYGLAEVTTIGAY